MYTHERVCSSMICGIKSFIISILYLRMAFRRAQSLSNGTLSSSSAFTIWIRFSPSSSYPSKSSPSVLKLPGGSMYVNPPCPNNVLNSRTCPIRTVIIRGVLPDARSVDTPFPRSRISSPWLPWRHAFQNARRTRLRSWMAVVLRPSRTCAWNINLTMLTYPPEHASWRIFSRT